MQDLVRILKMPQFASHTSADLLCTVESILKDLEYDEQGIDVLTEAYMILYAFHRYQLK